MLISYLHIISYRYSRYKYTLLKFCKREKTAVPENYIFHIVIFISISLCFVSGSDIETDKPVAKSHRGDKGKWRKNFIHNLNSSDKFDWKINTQTLFQNLNSSHKILSNIEYLQNLEINLLMHLKMNYVETDAGGEVDRPALPVHQLWWLPHERAKSSGKVWQWCWSHDRKQQHSFHIIYFITWL